MNKKQWVTFIIGVISTLIYWGSVVGNRTKDSVFWSYGKYHGRYQYALNAGPFIFWLLLIVGIFTIIIWAVRTKKEKEISEEIEVPKTEEKISPKKNFVEELKELANLREKGILSEEEFEKAKKRLFEES